MSGWLALVRTDGAPLDPAVCEPMLAPLRSRATGREAVVIDGSAVLALAPLMTGRAPPEAETAVEYEGWLVIGHVRVDDRAAVSHALGVDSKALPTMTDLELLARSVVKWGRDVPLHVAGEYGAAAWNRRTRTLLVLRDGFGVRTAFVAHRGPWAIASNSLDALLAHPAVNRDLDDEAIAELLIFEAVVTRGRTVYRNVRLAPAGGSWLVDASRPSPSPAESVAWRLIPPEVDRLASWRDQSAAWLSVLDVAVADRLRGARASISLSGGLDSTSILASAAVLGPEKLFAATEVAATTFDDEGAWAARAAGYVGVRQRSFIADRLRTPPGLDTSPEPTMNAFDWEPSGAWAAMSAHGGIVLHGEGGDEIWRATTLLDLAHESPFSLAYGVGATLALRRRPPLGLHWRRRWAAISGKKPFAVPPWLASRLRAAVDVEAIRAEGLRQITPSARGPRSGSVTGLTTALWQPTLAALDAPASDAKVEVTLPLLDRRVVDAALRLPPLPSCVDKVALRVALEGRLPPAVLARRKSGFADQPLPHLASADLAVGSPIGEYVDAKRFRESPPQARLSALALARWLEGRAGRPR